MGGATAAYAQFGGLGNVVRSVAAPALPNHDNFQPPAAQSLTSLERTKQGGFKLREGYYTMQA